MSVRQNNLVTLKLEVPMKRCLNSLKPHNNLKQQAGDSQTWIARAENTELCVLRWWYMGQLLGKVARQHKRKVLQYCACYSHCPVYKPNDLFPAIAYFCKPALGYESALIEYTIHRFKQYIHYPWHSNQTHTNTHIPKMSSKAKKLCLRYYSWVSDHPQI